MADPVVDIRIPTLGSSPYLIEAIESVVAQSFGAWRLTVSENGRGQESVAEALTPYLHDTRVEHVVTGIMLPRGAHFTRLIHSGDAVYVALLHDDDRWHQQFLEQRVAFLDANEGCGLVFGGTHVIDEHGNVLGRKRIPIPAGVHSSQAILPTLFQSNMITGASALVRRDAYETIDAVYSEGLFSDHEMWLRLASHFDVGCLRVWDSDFRVHEAQASATRRTEFGMHQLHMVASADDLPIPENIRRTERAKAYSQCALDAVEQSDRRQCVRYIGDAMRAYPLAVMRPKIAARLLVALLCIPLARPGRRFLAGWRDKRRRLAGLDIE